MRAGRIVLQALRVSCGSILVCFYLWTAHFAWYAPWIVAKYVIALPEWILTFTAVDPTFNPFQFIDFVCLGLLAAIAGATFVLDLGRGKAFALLKALQFSSLMMMVLGLSILTLDPKELWVYMTLTQYDMGFATWFTNGVDLVVSGIGFVISTVAVNGGWSRPWALNRK